MIKVIFNKQVESKYTAELKAADDETVEGAIKIFKTLFNMGNKCVLVAIDKNTIKEQIGSFRKNDIVVNYCEWTGKFTDYQYELMECIEKKGCKFTGCDLREHKLLMDKVVMKEEITRMGYPMLKSAIFTGKEISEDVKRMKFPLIVKTTKEHCSIGMAEDSITNDTESTEKKAKELFKKYSQSIMVEEFAEGNEYQVFVFETSKDPKTLPVYETVYKKSDKPVLMTYDDNWVNDSIISKIEKIGILKNREKDAMIREMARIVFIKLGGVGYVRMDLREKDGKLYILEINPNPSIAWTEDLDFIKVCADGAGMEYEDVIRWVMAKTI